MKKDVFLVMFPTRERGLHYLNDNLAPLLPDLKQNNKFEYETEKSIIKIIDFRPESYRGFSPRMIYLSNDAPLKFYNDILLMVKGEHYRISVVN